MLLHKVCLPVPCSSFLPCVYRGGRYVASGQPGDRDAQLEEVAVLERASQEGEEQSADPQREGTLRDSRSPTFFYIRAEPRTWLHLVL